MNGKKLYVSPPITAACVFNKRPLSSTPTRSRKPSMPIASTKASTGPLSLSSDCQEIVRSKKLVKNGTMTSPSSRFR